MTVILKCFALIGGAIATCFFLRKLIESIINLSVLLDKKNYTDGTLKHEGIVINKKTKKVEADNSMILPFN